MKVLITGHTHGIGKAILENCPSDYEVKGISRATGHDLIKNLPDTLGFIKEYNPDIFFNNAWGQGAQNEIAIWWTRNQNLKEPRVMITSGSVAGLKGLCDDEKDFYPGMPRLPYSEYGNAKRKLFLENYMHWIMDTREIYWTDYVLGWVKTRITVPQGSEELLGNMKMLEPDYVAKRMWNDIKNENYKNTFVVGMNNKRSGTEQERVMLMMKMLAETQKVGL
tara:strand:- start:404 stop:1069 length:666 start_codon:yes stop_codon:yes gene_type:complete